MIYPISIDKKLDRSEKLRPSVCFRLCAKATRKINSSRCLTTQADRFGCDVLYLASPYFLPVSVVVVLPNSDPHRGRCTTTDAKSWGSQAPTHDSRTDKRRDNWIHQPFVLCTVQRCLAGVKFDRPARTSRNPIGKGGPSLQPWSTSTLRATAEQSNAVDEATSLGDPRPTPCA